MFEAESTEDGYFAIEEQPRCQSPELLPLSSTALQYLPIPILILSSQKKVVLANEAMGRLLSIDSKSSDLQHFSISDFLQGWDMKDLGIDILQNGSPILVSWEVCFHGRLDQTVSERVGRSTGVSRQHHS